MKKLLCALFITSSVMMTSAANAKDGVYVGADLLVSQANYKFDDLYPTAGGVSKIDSNPRIGVGASLGYKKSFQQVFLAPELFYDYLNSSTKDYYYLISPYRQDSQEIRSRYGAKLNLGYDFTKKFSSYLTYGIAYVDFISNFPSVNDSQGKIHAAAIYGIGASYDLNDKWAIKSEFNSQRFNTRYQYYGGGTTTSKVRLNVLKIGAVYKF